ncbi:MAG: hypothetical protein HYV53_03015 [Parcubacteria group bacterium]|nr:hypothetical protein [Parcubacteria group bacterium]
MDSCLRGNDNKELMTKYFKKTIYLIVILAWPYIVLAAPAFDKLKEIGEGGSNPPYQAIDTNGTNSLAGIVGIVIQAFLGLLGVIFLVYMIYAGYAWMTAQGDEEKVTKAKDTIQRAIIGLIIIIAAYAISYFVLQKLVFDRGILNGSTYAS